CLLPLQALAVRADQLPALFLIYGIHAAVAGFVLIASFTGLGVRRADGLGLLFVLGLAANLLLYLYLLPYAVPTYPALMSSAFITLLISGPVIFSWRTRLISVQEEQLRRLSRELHDELGQSLTAVSSYLWLLERKLPPDLGELRTRAAEARRLVAKTLGEMRELSQLLRPPGLDLYGLA